MCVRISTNPLIGDYYKVNTDVLNDKQAENKIVSDATKKGLVQSVFGPPKPESTSTVYKIGDKMKSVVLLKGDIKDQEMKSQYNNGFPFPKPDIHGKCNMFNSAHFMMSD